MKTVVIIVLCTITLSSAAQDDENGGTEDNGKNHTLFKDLRSNEPNYFVATKDNHDD